MKEQAELLMLKIGGKLRDTEERDFEDILGLWYQDEAPYSLTVDDLKKWRNTLGSVFLTFEAQFKFAGFGLAFIDREKKAAYIQSVMVTEPYKNKGYSDAIFSKLVQELQYSRVRTITCFIEPQNETGRDMIERHGFVKDNLSIVRGNETVLLQFSKALSHE